MRSAYTRPVRRGRYARGLVHVLFVLGLVLPFGLWMHGIPAHWLLILLYFSLLLWVAESLGL